MMQQEICIRAGLVPEYFHTRLLEQSMQLSGGDRRHYLRLRTEFMRQQFLYGRFMLCRALSRAVADHITPEQWQFTRTDLGKPIIDPDAGLPAMHFNLSYAGRLVVLAVSSSYRIGIDIARLRDGEDIQITAALSPGEQEILFALPAVERSRRTLMIWVIKEAYSKLVGLGLHLDFATVTVEPSDKPLLFDPHNSHFLKNISLTCQCVELYQRQYLLSLACSLAV